MAQGQTNWAFFPLFPALTAALDSIGGFVPALSGLIVSTVALVGMMVVGAQYRAVTRYAASPWTWLLLLATWPFSVYFHAAYSEALYGFLALSAFLLLVKGRTLAAGLAAGLLSATRPIGILLAVWFGLRALGAVGARQPWRSALRLLLAACIGAAGLIGFMAWLWWRIGDPFAFLHAEAAWTRHTRNPLFVLFEGFSSVDVAAHRVGGAYLSLWAVAGLAATVLLGWRRRGAEAWLLGTTVLVALSSGSLWSMPRFVAASPSFLLAVADLLERLRSGKLRYAILVAFAALQLVMLRAWFRGAAFLV